MSDPASLLEKVRSAVSCVPKKLTEHRLRQRSKSMLDAGHTDDADLDIEAADRISTLERELEEVARNHRQSVIPLYASPQPEAYGVTQSSTDSLVQRLQGPHRRSECGNFAEVHPDFLNELDIALTAAEAKAARMGEALKPFSVAAGGVFTRNFNASDVLFRKPASASGAESVITAGHLFAARAALQSTPTSDRS
jgi:hypothetical protein